MTFFTAYWLLHLSIATLQLSRTQAADPSLGKVYKEEGIIPKVDWVIHDPSRIVTRKNKQMIAVTGKGNDGNYDCGLETWWRKKKRKGKWKPGQCLLQEKPDWVAEETTNGGAFWAPEMVDRKTILYSVGAFETDRPTTCVGLVRGKGKFPKKMTWTDAGEPIFCIIGQDYEEERSAIDPSIYKGFDGKTYLVSGGGVIIGTELDDNYMPKSGNWFSSDDEAWKELSRGPSKIDDTWVEAAYIIPKELDGKQYYFLFVNFYACCGGTQSTYEIHVGRGTNPLGPFTNKDGVDMMDFDETTNLETSLFLATEDYMIGPGHMAHYSKGPTKRDIMTFHYYDNRREDGKPWIGERELDWESGWPVAGKILSSYDY